MSSVFLFAGFAGGFAVLGATAEWRSIGLGFVVPGCSVSVSAVPIGISNLADLTPDLRVGDRVRSGDALWSAIRVSSSSS